MSKILLSLSIIILCSLCGLFNAKADQDKKMVTASMEEMFLSELRSFFDLLSEVIENEEESIDNSSDLAVMVNMMTLRAQRYPENRFADDVILIPRVMLLQGILISDGVSSQRIQELIQDLEQDIDRYPDGVFEEKALAISPLLSGSPLSMPRKYLPSYFKAELYMREGDYNAAIQEFEYLKEKVALVDGTPDHWRSTIYGSLLLAFYKSDQTDLIEPLVQEAQSNFPDSHIPSRLQTMFDKVKAKQKK